MWEMIERMATDRLWIYTALAGSLFGAAFLFWFKDTRIATWAVGKFDKTLEYLEYVGGGPGYKTIRMHGV